jgi:putative oxidoreductase
MILLVRVWLGYRMCAASYSYVTDNLFHPQERAFFIKWFGEELHFPMPLTMAFLAKSSELSGGILVLAGFFTRSAASLIAFTMLIATLTANLGENWNIDGGFTVSYLLFAIVLVVEGGGKYSLDFLVRKNKKTQVFAGLS